MSSFVNTHAVGENRIYAPMHASFKDENERKKKWCTRWTRKCKQRRRTQWRIPIIKQKWRKSQKQNQLCRYKVGALLIKHFFFFAGDQPRIILQKIREKNLYTFSSDGPCETKNGPHTFFKQQNELLSDKPVAFEIQVESFVCVISNTRDHAMFQRRGDIRSFELLSNTQRYSSHQPADKTRDQIQNNKVNEMRKISGQYSCIQNNCSGTFSGWPLVEQTNVVSSSD